MPAKLEIAKGNGWLEGVDLREKKSLYARMAKGETFFLEKKPSRSIEKERPIKLKLKLAAKRSTTDNGDVPMTEDGDGEEEQEPRRKRVKRT